MSKLPGHERASIDLRKLTDYLLDPTHHRGRHKARVFRAALGIGKEDAEWLRDRIFAAASTEEAKFTFKDEFGARYEVDFQLVGLEKEVTIRSSWIIRHNETFPRFIGSYVV